MNFGWNIDQWAANETPSELRQEPLVSWHIALLRGIKLLWLEFTAYRLATLKKMRYNSQVIVLENLLNDLFDNALRRIVVITTYDVKEPEHVFTSAENQPLYIFTDAELDADPSLQQIYTYTNPELGVQYDFIVQAAAGSLTAEEIVRLKSFVKYYRLAGKREYYQYDNLQPF